MIIRKSRLNNLLSSEITPKKVFNERRKFLQQSTLTAGVLALSLIPKKVFSIQSKFSNLRGNKWSKVQSGDKLTSYKDITNYNNFYEFGTGKTDPVKYSKNFISKPWNIKVDGLCEKPGLYAYEDIIKQSQLEERIYRLRCVEAWSMVIPWVGVPLFQVIKTLEPSSDAKYVAFETLFDPRQMPGQNSKVIQWPYREGLRLDEAMHPLTLLAIGIYGEEMPNQNGAPIRLVVPWKYGFKSIKSIVRISFLREIPATSWNMASPNEYGFYSNVNPHVPHPRWSQSKERRIGEFFKRPTLMFNGYGEEVAHLYDNMDLKRFF